MLSQHIEMKQCENNSSDFLQEIETEVSAMTKFCKSTLPKCAYLKELEGMLLKPNFFVLFYQPQPLCMGFLKFLQMRSIQRKQVVKEATCLT